MRGGLVRYRHLLVMNTFRDCCCNRRLKQLQHTVQSIVGTVAEIVAATCCTVDCGISSVQFSSDVYFNFTASCHRNTVVSLLCNRSVLSQGNRAMPQLFVSV